MTFFHLAQALFLINICGIISCRRYARTLKGVDDMTKYTSKNPERNFVLLSDFVEEDEGNELLEALSDCYFLISDYAAKADMDFIEHFFLDYVPGVFNGTCQIISCYQGDEIIATTIVKKAHGKQKEQILSVVCHLDEHNEIANEMNNILHAWLGNLSW